VSETHCVPHRHRNVQHRDRVAHGCNAAHREEGGCI